MNVSNCMRTKVLLADPDCHYKDLLYLIARPEARQIYIVDKAYQLLGLITSYDLIKKIVPSYMTADLARSIANGTAFMQKQVEKVQDLRARDIMVTDFVSLAQRSQLLEADALIAEKGCQAFPVLDDNGRLVGELTRLDVLTRFVDNYLEPARAVPELFDLASINL